MHGISFNETWVSRVAAGIKKTSTEEQRAAIDEEVTRREAMIKVLKDLLNDVEAIKKEVSTI